MKRGIVVALVLALVGAAAWFVLRGDSTSQSEPKRAAAPAEKDGPSAKSPKSRPLDDAPRIARVDRKRKVSKAEREAFRKRIAEGVARREAQRERGEAPREESPEPAKADDEGEEPSEGIKDRSDGKLTPLIGAINEDFLPLANECYEQALEADPELRGMLDMNFKIIADEDIGGIVDEVELGEENEIHDAGMHECIRETILSTIFPPPESSGLTGVRMTLRFEPEQPSE